jgi:signal transduction histidine kinase
VVEHHGYDSATRAGRALAGFGHGRGASTGPRSEGAGLGLAIIRAIAVGHGGQVLLDSVLGRGATFTVVVPATRPEENPS